VTTDESADPAARELLILKVCLDEITRSRPFLIGLLGHRYGWVPPPERVAALTGISKEDVVFLAREYATQRPAALRLNYGIQRTETGGMAVRTVALLPVLTGSWKEVGGGMVLSTSGAFHLNRPALKLPELENRVDTNRRYQNKYEQIPYD
jgi:anaerobic selenocysteine-containing dehydrogenase